MAVIAGAVALSVPALGAPVDSAAHVWVGDLAPLAEADFGYEQAAHLLERAGFGGTPAQIEELAALGLEGAVARLVDYESIDDSGVKPFDESGDLGRWDGPVSRPAAPRRCGSHGATDGRWASTCCPRGHRGRCNRWSTSSSMACAATCWRRGRLALWWGRPHGRHAAAARREDDPLLARPLRDLGGQGPRRPEDGPAEPDPSRPRYRRLPRSGARGHARPGDARLPGQPGERKGPRERELRPRAARAVHDGGGQLHRAGHPGGVAGVHRLDQRGARLPLRRRTPRRRWEDVFGARGQPGRRGRARHHPRAAGHRRVHRRQDLPLLGTRGSGARAPGETGAPPAGVRIRTEGPAAHDPLVARLLQSAVGRGRRSRVRFSWSS